jgi:hypothetical protein
MLRVLQSIKFFWTHTVWYSTWPWFRQSWISRQGGQLGGYTSSLYLLGYFQKATTNKIHTHVFNLGNNHAWGREATQFWVDRINHSLAVTLSHNAPTTKVHAKKWHVVPQLLLLQRWFRFSASLALVQPLIKQAIERWLFPGDPGRPLQR